MRRWFFAAGMVVLSLGVLAQWAASVQVEQPRMLEMSLGQRLPAALEGWLVVEQPIADTPEMKKAVGALLNYDDAVFRIYRRGALQFAVYVAYWGPGRMPRREVASHTPDVCWALNGWVPTLSDLGKVIQVEQQKLRPAQFRVFSMNAQPPQYVLFWHLADGELVTYQNGRGVGWLATATDLFRFGIWLKPEQVFVRISSDTPFEQLEQLNGFRQVVLSLLPLGLITESKTAK